MIIATHGSLAAGRIDHLNYHQAPPAGVSWPVLVGQIPARASAFQDRLGLRSRVDEARAGSQDVVLTQVLSGGGGVGKSQLAASFARRALASGTDLVVWVDAAQPGAVVEAFARAARLIRAPGAQGADAQTDAQEFLAWAATTSRTWLVVLDDITEPTELSGWWPAGPSGTGWVLATTRRRDAILSGASRTMINVDAYTPDQALAYLAERLGNAGYGRLVDARAPALCAELGYLPLALSHAAAYMIENQATCAGYLGKFTASLGRLDDLLPASADADGYGRSVAATMLLALDAADRCDPAGLARPAIRLAALLDPAGYPATLYATRAATSYLTHQRTTAASAQEPPADVTSAQAREALLLLHRYALATFADQDGPRAVRIHALTARAARETLTPARPDAAVLAAAAALMEEWPEPDHTAPALSEALRASTTTLTRHAKDDLWQHDGHPVIFQAGLSMLNAGLHAAATSYWEQTTADSERILGPDHPSTLTARANLAFSYWQAGRTADAIAIEEQVTADRERILGPDHPDTLTPRSNLASSY